MTAAKIKELKSQNIIKYFFLFLESQFYLYQSHFHVTDFVNTIFKMKVNAC